MRRILYICLILSVNAINIYALNFIHKDEYLAFRRYTTDEGLSHMQIETMGQDADDVMWIGTRYGLNSFAGSDFTHFANILSDSTSISSSRITNIHRDTQNRLWIGTSDGGLNLFNPNTETFDRFITQAEVSDITSDTYNNLYIAVAYQGIAKLVNDSPLEFQTYNYSEKYISTLYNLDKDFLVAGTKENGILLFDKRSNTYHTYTYATDDMDFTASEIMDIERLGNRLFFATNRGLFTTNINSLLENNKLEIHSCSLGTNFSTSNALCRMNDILWCATNNGLLKLEENDDNQILYTQFNHKRSDLNSLSSNSITGIYVDNAKGLWVATSIGLNYCDLEGIQVENIIDSNLDRNVVTSMYVDKYAQIWVGLFDGKLCKYSPDTEKITTYEINQNGSIDCIVQDPWGYLWVGGWGNGLIRFSLNEEQKNKLSSRQIQQSRVPNLSDKFVTSLAFYKQDLYVGTHGSGIDIIQFNKKGAIKAIIPIVEKTDALASNYINNLYNDPIGKCLWISTTQGLNRLMANPEYTIDCFNQAGSNGHLSHDFVWEVLRTSPKDLWVGTIYDGLNHIEFHDDGITPKSLSVYRQTDGMLSNSIQALEYDSINNSLFVTSNGITRIDVPTGNIMTYNQDEMFNGSFFRVNSSAKLPNGNICFGSNKGLNILNVKRLPERSIQPKIRLNKLYLNNREVRSGDTIEGEIILKERIDKTNTINVKYNQNHIALDIEVVHFKNLNNYHLIYRLDGYDTQWTKAPLSPLHLNYDKLDHGDYQFTIKLINDQDHTITRRLTIQVARPWWRSWYAYLIYTILLGLIFYTVISYLVIKFKMRQERILSRLTLEKQQELATLKINFFTNITHELITPLSLIIDPIDNLIEGEKDQESKKYLTTIQRNANRLHMLVSQLLDFRKIEVGTLKLRLEQHDIVHLLSIITESFEYSVKHKGLAYDFSTNMESFITYADKDCLEKIVHNLLSNALKYTTTGSIHVALKVLPVENKFTITITDTGIGINSEDRDRIFDSFYQSDHHQVRGAGIGLALVKSLVELYEGEIDFRSTPHNGTTFEVCLPLRNIESEPTAILDTTESTATQETKHTILIVEDNKELLEYMVNELKHKYTIYQATDGEKGYEIAKTKFPSVIISDVMMPVMDGVQMCRLIKGNTATSRIPVILLTAKITEEDQLEGIESGADLYLTKPFKISVLNKYLQNMISHSKVMKQYYSSQKSDENQSEDIVKKDFVEKVNTVIMANLSNEKLDSKILASELHIAYPTLYNKLKKNTGYSVTGYIRFVRLTEASRLIANSSMSINEIQYYVGFNDTKYFRTCFKEHFEMTPSEYLKKFRFI